MKNGVKRISNIIQHVLRLDDEIQKYKGEFNEKERKIKRQLRVDLLRWSIELIAAHESTLIPKSDSKDEQKNGEKEPRTDSKE